MEKEKKTTNIAQKIAKVILKTILFLFLFIVFVFIMVFTPPVQHFLTGKVQTYLQDKLKTKVVIGSISFGMSGKINLKNVFIEDKTKDTLVSGGSIKAHLNFFKLFSNEVEVKDLELQNITAKIKRVLPDTTFNFQFIVDAFISEKTKKPDTAKTAPLKLSISDIALDNISLVYNDVITGSDMVAHIGTLSATIDTLDPYAEHFDIPTLIARNVQARIRQFKPLITPKPLAQDIAQANAPTALKLSIGTIDLNKIAMQYDNDVSALYTTINIGQLKTKEKTIDLQNNKIYLDELTLNNSKMIVRLGKKQEAKVVAQQVNQKIQAEKTAGWDFKITHLQLANNTIQFDNDNNPRLLYGMDYSHILGNKLNLYADNFVMNTDSVGLQITKGSVYEKSGFQIDQVRGDLLYANNQTYLKNLYIKTPGSEIQKTVLLKYPSTDALKKNFSQVVLNLELVNSHLQVKDILTFAPQLRSNPAMADPNAVWYLNIVGSGTLDRLNFESLRFDGLRNTHLNAQGSLTGLMNPKQAGGNFTIYRFHTTQSDMALFTGKRLSNQQMSLPEEFDINGTITGNTGKLNTNLNVATSEGFIGINGRFSNLTDLKTISYNASLRTTGLQLGKILRNPAQYGSFTGNFTVNGRGASANNINTRFTGIINSAGYNKYQYRNIRLNGFIKQSDFSVTTISNDPNAAFNLTASGSITANPSFKINGMIDSIKTLPLHLTTTAMIFRGQVDATASNITGDNVDATILITKGLFVSGTNRLPLDTLQLISGRNDTANYIQLKSNIANAYVTGDYRLADLGSIVQNSIEPYFSVTPPSKKLDLQPYNFRFTADAVYSPVLAAFVPSLTAMDPIHAEGSFISNGGMNAIVTAPHIVYGGNDISNLTMRVTTSDSGLHLLGSTTRIKSGSSFDLYNTRINATALNNNINFSLGIDDQYAKNKYYLQGLLTQPAQGTYAVNLKPDSLLLNYQRWTVPANNLITIGTTNITASNFVLQKGNQQLSIASLAAVAGAQPLQVNFSNFQLATLTGFIKSDSLLVDGMMNGNVTFRNIMQQPVFTSDLTINDLSLRQDTLGNARLQVSTGNSNRYNTNVTLTGRGNDIALTGYFAPAGNNVNLNLDLNVKALQLHTMEGALASAITNASGAVNGTVKIAGTTGRPQIIGDLNFDKASFALTPLGSQFKIDNEKLSITQNGFAFNNFTIRDSANNTLALNGTVLTSNFINYTFNLDVAAQNFEVLNNTKVQNKLYYGKLNITSKVHIAGTEIKPVVDGSVTVNKGTNLNIVVPQSEPGVQERKGIVQFVDMKSPENDSLFLKQDSVHASNTLGMDIAANIIVNKDAVFNVIIDPANGDFLNVQGTALLSAGIDPSGKITLTGTYTLEQGSYQFSFNFLQRKFDIQKGSTITWTGGPTTAQLNVTAIYIANTAPLDLVSDQISAPTAAIRNTYLQKLPFEVHLNLTGELLKPVVAFDIVLPQDKNYGVSNDIVTAVQSKLDQLRQDQGEINKQVFSLLLLGRFIGQNPFTSSGGNAFDVASYARQSVSKLLTEQLNQMAAGLISGVDLNFDVASTDDYTTGSRRNRTDLNIGLSKRLLNDRLKVSVGSNFELQGPQNSNQKNNNIAGNIAADYQLSRDGKYLLRFYRKNQYEGVVDGYIIETGIGFILSVDYNKFSQLFNRKKQKVTSKGAN